MIKIHPMFYKTAAVASAGVFSYIYLYAIGHALHESALHKKKTAAVDCPGLAEYDTSRV